MTPLYDNCYAAHFDYNSESLVIIANASETTSRAISLDVNGFLPSGASEYHIFSGRTGRLSMSAGIMTGTMPAKDVQVYLLTATPPA